MSRPNPLVAGCWEFLSAAVRWLIVPVIAGIFLLGFPDEFPDAWNAAHGRGHPGTFVPMYEECAPRGGCDWYGIFTGDDGTTLTDIGIDAGPAVHEGDHVRVLMGDQTAMAYRATKSHEWRTVLTLAVLAGFAVLCWLIAVMHRLRTGHGIFASDDEVRASRDRREQRRLARATKRDPDR